MNRSPPPPVTDAEILNQEPHIASMTWHEISEDAKAAKSVLLLSIYGVSLARWNVSDGIWNVLLNSETNDLAYESNGSAGDDPGPRHEPSEIYKDDVLGYMPIPKPRDPA